MKRETLIQIATARARGRALVRAVDMDTGEERLLAPGDPSPLGELATAAARSDRSEPVTCEGRNWFLTVYNTPLDLVIVGAVHIGQFLASMAQQASYGVRIIDPRTAFATQERFPSVELSHDWADEALQKKPLTSRSAVVALTHDPKLDDPALTAALRSDCFYIGALGSRKTHAARLERLKKNGFDDTALARIHGPIGLNIGARSPAEIAVSIIAEMTQELRAGGGGAFTARAGD